MFQRISLRKWRGLLKRYPSAQAFKAIGYRQVAAYLQGKISLAQAIEETQLHSRRYAKRQLTWFRSDKTIIWLGIDNVEKEAQEVVGKFLQDHEKK